MAQLSFIALCFSLAAILLSVIPLAIQQIPPLIGVDLFNNQLHQSEIIEFKSSSELWFRQTLDHFDTSGSKKETWRQRYFQRWGHVKKCCLEKTPNFLILGGEFESSEWLISKDFAVDSYAKKYGALLVTLEHRFYGKSKPTANLSTENLKKYLSAKQALADAANFIRGYKKENNFGKGNKVVVFGGSYPGMLATWLRAEYPDVVAGAIASSAPLLAKLDFKEYLEVVAKGLEAHKCLKQVKTAFSQLYKLLNDSSQAGKLTKLFNTCVPVNASNKFDIEVFVDLLVSHFAVAAKFNDTLQPRTAFNLPRVCRIMFNSKHSPLENLAILIFLRQFTNIPNANGTNQNCLENSYKSTMEYFSSVESAPNKMARQWVFQTCNEFGFFQTASSEKQPFGSADIDILKSSLLACRIYYGISKKQVACNIRAINRKYGGLKPNATNVLLINGDTDPWHALGVKNGIISNKVEGLMIPRGSHHLDMMANYEGDSTELRAARTKTMERIGEFLKE